MFFDERLDFFREKYNKVSSICSRISRMEKLIEEGLEKNLEQIQDIMSEIEVINFFENLLSIRFKNENIDQVIPNSTKDCDITFDFEVNKILVEVKNLSNVTILHNKTKKVVNGSLITSGISNPIMSYERLRMKILTKTEEKLQGLNEDLLKIPFILVLSPYSDLTDASPFYEAVQSPLIYDIDTKMTIPEDRYQDAFKRFDKIKMLLSAVVYTKFRVNDKNQPDLDSYCETPPYASNKIPRLLFEKLNKRVKNGDFEPKVYPSQIRYTKK